MLALRDADGLTEAKSEPAAIDELLNNAMFERPKPRATTAETVAADLERTAHDIPITVNERVLSFIELFQGRLREFMQAGLDRGAQYLPMIQAIFREEGVPLDLAFVPLVESAFKSNALSRASARGMWQFMLGTAQDHGLEQNWFLDERSDPKSRRAPRRSTSRRSTRCSTATGTSRSPATTPGPAVCRAPCGGRRRPTSGRSRRRRATCRARPATTCR